MPMTAKLDPRCLGLRDLKVRQVRMLPSFPEMTETMGSKVHRSPDRPDLRESLGSRSPEGTAMMARQALRLRAPKGLKGRRARMPRSFLATMGMTESRDLRFRDLRESPAFRVSRSPVLMPTMARLGPPYRGRRVRKERLDKTLPSFRVRVEKTVTKVLRFLGHKARLELQASRSPAWTAMMEKLVHRLLGRKALRVHPDRTRPSSPATMETTVNKARRFLGRLGLQALRV
jgi:hypothetical protein